MEKCVEVMGTLMTKYWMNLLLLWYKPITSQYIQCNILLDDKCCFTWYMYDNIGKWGCVEFPRVYP